MAPDRNRLGASGVFGERDDTGSPGLGGDGAGVAGGAAAGGVRVSGARGPASISPIRGCPAGWPRPTSTPSIPSGKPRHKWYVLCNCIIYIQSLNGNLLSISELE